MFGFVFDMMNSRANVRRGPEELTLKVERTVQKAFVDTTKIDRNKWELPKVDSGWSALRQTMHDRDVARQVGIRSVGGHHFPGGGEREEEPVRPVMTGIVEVMRFPPVGTQLNSAPLRNCGCSNSVDPGAGN